MDDKDFNNEGLGYDFSYDKKRKNQKTTVGCCIVFLVVVLIIILCSMHPEIWHPEAQENKRVMMEYIATNFPDAKITKQRYHSAEIKIGAPSSPDFIFLQQDGVEFHVWAQDGYCFGDTYNESCAKQYVESIMERFFEPRGIEPLCNNIIFFDPVTSPDIAQYNGNVRILLVPAYDPEINTPQEIDWLYDFYQYWKACCGVNKYYVEIEYRIGLDSNHFSSSYDLAFNENTIFDSREEFYAAFKEKKYE